MQEHATNSPFTLNVHPVLPTSRGGEKADTLRDHYFEAVPVKDIGVGEFVRKISKDGSMQAKTYRRGAYDRGSKSYALTDCGDVNREIFVKGFVKLAIGFTY